MTNKSTTIKGATDKELDEIIKRLRKENEAQSLIADLKRKGSSGYTPYDYGLEISTEKPIDDLYHFGIPGMRWGRKKAVVPTSTTKVVRTSNSEDHDKKNLIKTKKLNELTNDEIRTYTQRMALEKQFKELSKAERSLGKKLVDDIVNSVTKGARDAAMNYVNKQAAKLVDDLIKKSTKAVS